MFQNMLMTTLTPLSDTNEINQWENRPFMSRWPEPSHQKCYREPSITKTIKKRNKRNRTSYTTEQLKILERTFARTKYINTEHRKELAESLNIGEKCIKVWFQNRRMKEKRESSESSCDSSSDYVEPITPPPANPTPSYEEYIVPSHYNTVRDQETGTYYQYTDNTKEMSQLHAYYQNYNADLNTDYNINAFASENFRNDTNIYPTQYYPSTEAVYTSSYVNLEEYQQPKEQPNWSTDAFDLNFL